MIKFSFPRIGQLKLTVRPFDNIRRHEFLAQHRPYRFVVVIESGDRRVAACVDDVLKELFVVRIHFEIPFSFSDNGNKWLSNLSTRFSNAAICLQSAKNQYRRYGAEKYHLDTAMIVIGILFNMTVIPFFKPGVRGFLS